MEIFRYLLVSIVAVAFDIGAFVALTAIGLHYLPANLLAALLGIGCNYILSQRYVFRTAERFEKRIHASLFFGIGFAGLVVNSILMVVSIEQVGLVEIIGKFTATAGSFVFNYVARKLILYRIS
jgi:dolichol-phosphate mannosyltransferase